MSNILYIYLRRDVGLCISNTVYYVFAYKCAKNKVNSCYFKMKWQ